MKLRWVKQLKEGCLINNTEWFKDWFESSIYLSLYKKRNEHEAKAAIELILKNTLLDKNARCIDLACGSGRHSIALSEKNFNVTGFDISKNLLRLASVNSTLISPKPNFVRGDIRCLPFKQSFDIAVNLFTSWGYFLDDKENESVISGVKLLLKNRGYFILDFLNCDYLTKNLVPESFEKIDDFSILQKRFITNQRVEKIIKIQKDDIVNEYRESVRLYSREEIYVILQKNDFEVIKLFGDYNGNPVTENSSRLFFICRKNEN